MKFAGELRGRTPGENFGGELRGRTSGENFGGERVGGYTSPTMFDRFVTFSTFFAILSRE
jgi:hypothetical protein